MHDYDNWKKSNYICYLKKRMLRAHFSVCFSLILYLWCFFFFWSTADICICMITSGSKSRNDLPRIKPFELFIFFIYAAKGTFSLEELCRYNFLIEQIGEKLAKMNYENCHHLKKKKESCLFQYQFIHIDNNYDCIYYGLIFCGTTQTFIPKLQYVLVIPY